MAFFSRSSNIGVVLGTRQIPKTGMKMKLLLVAGIWLTSGGVFWALFVALGARFEVFARHDPAALAIEARVHH